MCVVDGRYCMHFTLYCAAFKILHCHNFVCGMDLYNNLRTLWGNSKRFAFQFYRYCRALKRRLRNAVKIELTQFNLNRYGKMEYWGFIAPCV